MAGLVGLGASLGCGTSEVLTTTGRSYTVESRDSYAQAARESAMTDLHCAEPIVVRVVTGFKDSKFVADGCGQRAVYECATRSDLSHVGFTESHGACEMVLMSKFTR